MEAYPLYWPTGYKRTTNRIESRFKVTMDKAQRFLHSEIKRIEGTDLIVSTNIPTRKDGMLYTDWMNRKIDDPGVAIYFKYKGKNVSMCCDQYIKIWENVYALGKGIEALRGLGRWGVSDFLNRAFTGFTAIPEYIKTEPWWQILGLKSNATEIDIKNAFRQKAKLCHPDLGGSSIEFSKVQNAYQQALKQLNNNG